MARKPNDPCGVMARGQRSKGQMRQYRQSKGPCQVSIHTKISDRYALPLPSYSKLKFDLNLKPNLPILPEWPKRARDATYPSIGHSMLIQTRYRLSKSAKPSWRN